MAGSKRASIRIPVTFAGRSFTGKVDQLADGLIDVGSSAHPAAQAGSLTTRTDNDTGVVTISATVDDVVNGNYVDLYWTNADGTLGHRYGMLASGVTGAGDPSIAVDGGAGDSLPALSTVVAIAVCHEEAFALTGDNALFLEGDHNSAEYAIFNFCNNTHVSQYVLIVSPQQDASVWASDMGTTNPLAGLTISKILMSHGDTVNAANLNAGALYS